jgi:hypothetical protein
MRLTDRKLASELGKSCRILIIIDEKAMPTTHVADDPSLVSAGLRCGVVAVMLGPGPTA